MTVGIRTKSEPWCPECGPVMKLRKPNPHQIWLAFWGCSTFPDCDGTRQIDENTGMPERDDNEPPR